MAMIYNAEWNVIKCQEYTTAYPPHDDACWGLGDAQETASVACCVQVHKNTMDRMSQACQGHWMQWISLSKRKDDINIH